MNNPQSKNIIVHGTGNGPDYYRLKLILTLKNIPWAFSPHCPPIIEQVKELGNNLPIMQYGPCFFEGSMISTLALEQLQPDPSLFPNGNCGMPLALAWWSDSFYRAMCKNYDTSLLSKNCTLISRQIADGRDYLQGEKPGLADVHSFAPLKALHEEGRDISAVMNAEPTLNQWYKNMDTLKSNDPDALLPLIPPEYYPECSTIADKKTLDNGKIVLWLNAPL